MHVVKTSFMALAASALLLAACNGQQNALNAEQGGALGGGGFDKSDIGTGLGAIGGGVAGAQFGHGEGKLVTTALGALLGAGIGHEVGASLDRADMSYYKKTQQTALETAQPNQPLPWNNSQNGHSGTVSAAAPYKNDDGQYCREFTNKINVGGQTQTGYGTACRQSDGTWQIVSSDQ